MSHVDLTTTVSGPGTLIVEAIHMGITITISSISLPTSMVPETEFEVETTSKSTRPSPAEFTQPSVYMTRTVELASNMNPVTSTIYTIIPVTARVGTATVTRPYLPSISI